LQLRRRFRHRRTGDGPVTGLAPKRGSLFDQTGRGVMLREELGLVFCDL
jgi:hypothetical protein